MLTNEEVRQILPHRYPLLLVDKVLLLEPGKRVVAQKAVSANESFFEHHQNQPLVMPEVFIIEALAQTACIAGLTLPENKGKVGLFTNIEVIEFFKPVIPGDILQLEAEFYFYGRGICKVNAEAKVDHETVAAGKLGFYLMEQKI